MVFFPDSSQLRDRMRASGRLQAFARRARITEKRAALCRWEVKRALQARQL